MNKTITVNADGVILNGRFFATSACCTTATIEDWTFPSVVSWSNPASRKRCEYCGCLSQHDYGVCDHCGAPL